MKRIINLFSRENSLRSASIVLIVTLTLSNILGLFRDRFLAKNITTYNLDIYYASFRIPDLIFNFLILGAITSAFIPVFSDFIAKGEKKEAIRMTNILVNFAMISMVVFAIILFFLMPYLVPLVVPKFDTIRMDQTIKLSRILMLTPIFFSFSYIMGGVLNCYKRFIAYSLAPIIYNLSIIIGAMFMAPIYGIIGVVYAVIAGSILHLLIQLVPAIGLGYRYSPVLSFKDSSINKIVKLMVPRTISMGANQIMLIAYTAIASALAAGSIAAFNLANNIETMPVVVLGTSFATVLFPTLASKIAEKKEDEFAFYLNRALRTIGFLCIPSSILFILFRAQIIRLILGSGKFSWNDTRVTAMTLGFFSLSILAQGLIPILSRAFYALKDTKTPMNIAIATVALSIIIAYPLAQIYSVAGLALAFSVGSYFNAIVLLHYLRKRYPGVLNTGLALSFLKTLFVSLGMGALVWGAMHFMANHVDMNRFVGVLIQTLVAGIFGVAVYAFLSYLFHQEELKWAITRNINGKR